MENTRKFSILHHPGSLALLNDIILFIKEGKKRGGEGKTIQVMLVLLESLDLWSQCDFPVGFY